MNTDATKPAGFVAPVMRTLFLDYRKGEELNIRNTDHHRLIKTTLTILLFCITACSKSEVKSTDLRLLKKAAIDCNVAAFIDYMPADTVTKVNEFEDYMKKISQAVDSIFQRSKQMFGDGVGRTEEGINIPIEGTDPRWTEILGPQWSAYANNPANGPFYFKLLAVAKWEQECSVVQTFQACLEDQDFCSEYYVKGSVIRMTRSNDSWELIFTLTQEEYQKSGMMKESLLKLLLWGDGYLSSHRNSIPNEDFKIEFAEAYLAKMQQLFLEMQHSAS